VVCPLITSNKSITVEKKIEGAYQVWTRCFTAKDKQHDFTIKKKVRVIDRDQLNGDSPELAMLERSAER
jgi:hypothetical protein